MSLDAIFAENLDNLTEEMLANRILLESSVNYNDVPIIIEKVAVNLGFKLGKTVRFVKEEILAGIAYTEKENVPLNSKRYIVVRDDLEIRDRRYLISIALAYYVLESSNQYYIKSITNDVLSDVKNTRVERVARAVLMPQKSMSTLLMSPMISKLDIESKVNSVAKAFLVPNYAARTRMIETGFFM